MMIRPPKISTDESPVLQGWFSEIMEYENEVSRNRFYLAHPNGWALHAYVVDRYRSYFKDIYLFVTFENELLDRDSEFDLNVIIEKVPSRFQLHSVVSGISKTLKDLDIDPVGRKLKVQ